MNEKPDLVTRDAIGESTDEGNGEEWQLVLEESEAAILRGQIAEPDSWLNSTQFLWSCTSVWDGMILLGSGLAAVVAGAALPLSMLLLGSMGQSFRDFFVGSSTRADFTDDVNRLCLFYIYLAIAEFVAVYIATVGFTMAGERITQRIREAYLAAVLRQNIAYFESLKVGEVNTRLTADVNSIQDAITGKASATLTAVATFVSAVVICFVTSWRLSLVMLAAPTLIIASMSITATFMVKYTSQSLAAYAPAASIAEEAISSIRTVAAFGMQSRLVGQYKVHLETARDAGVKSGVALACMLGVMNAVIFWSYGLAFWQGSRWLMHDKVSLSAILTILFAVIIGAFALGNVSPHAQAFVNGITTVEKLSQAVSRNSAIDPSLVTGHTLPEINGEIELKNIRHVYPSRPDTLVVDNFCHTFPPGKMTAIVGPSGCGKSTIVGLIERFYLPVRGSIYLDGHDISSLNVSWLRQQIGLVSQEPTLFSTTVFENIRHGLIGSQYQNLSLETIREMVERAARTANAFEFIMDLPEGFMTQVDDRGASLSGGQKQRIAIARAIVGDPKILILDEATSALDTNSEQNVQLALEKAAQGRTTIAIAHRLSTIFAADNILVMSKGEIVDQGTHEELVRKGSVYAEMVSNQQINRETAAPEDHEKSNVKKGEETFCAEVTEVNCQAVEKSDTEDQAGRSVWTLARFVFRLNANDKLILLIGLCCSVVAGASYPTQSVFLAKLVQALSVQPSLYGHLRQEVNLWCGMYLMIGFTTLLGWLGQGVCFAYYSQRLTYHARASTFATTLHHDMASFLREDHSTASLTSILSNSANNLQGLSGVVLGTLLVILTQLTAGFTVATVIGWKLGLVCASTIPIQIGCGILRLKCLTLLESHSRRMYESSAAYACEYSANIRTVAPLTLEPKILDDYHKILETQRKKSFTSMTQSSLLYAASQSLNLLCVALAFWYGGHLVATGNYTMFQFFVCYTAVVNGAYSAGAIFSFAPDIGKARDSAISLKALFDRPVDIDARSDKGTSLNRIRGAIQLCDVSFRYPNRPEQIVLDGISLDVRPGQYVALVGASGSGKSTVVSLLERFFDPDSGSIAVDGVSLSEWNVRDYRRQVALVSQMPTLFDGTIRENIVLGLRENEEASDADIIKACKDANIYDFITSLPDGLNTRVGARGTMLSGGQKQRVAIARALIGNPKVLLLDEATSALDSESERAVQKALDAAAGSRTTIAIAHRISTVERADCIYVLDHGQIVESGTHQALMKLNGKYKDLVTFQSFGEATA